VLVCASACSDPPVELFVDLRTDYVGGVEARLARVQLLTADGETPIRTVETPLIEEDLTDGVRIAELADLSGGEYRVVVALEGLTRVPVRTIRVTLETSRAVTVLITRDCQTVTCPMDDASPLTECLGGLCVDPTCTPEDPASCPDAECSADTDCTTTVACASPLCVEGVCTLRANSSMCAMTEYCDPTMGCRVRPGLPPVDSGVDGGPDAGMDASADTAVDAPLDAPEDAPDAAPDADADAGGSGVVDLAAGYAHSCAIVHGGELWCWGSNASGELGDPTLGTSSDVPSRIGTSADWTAVSVGGRFDSGPIGFSCAIRSGELYCWGKNEHGELGLGSMMTTDTPTRVGTGTDWTDIAVSWTHAHGLRGAGELWSWGEAFALGLDDDTTDRLAPERVGTALWREVAAGQEHGCGIRMDGSLWCWGNGYAGALALGSSRTYELSPQRVGTGSDWYGLAETCALRTGGALYCWGSNSNGRVGDGTMIDAFSPVEIAASGYAEVASSILLSFGITTTGALSTWGDNQEGQCGNGAFGADVLMPAVADAGPGWRLVAPGELHGCAVRDDEVYCWGLHQDGRTGLGASGIRAITPMMLSF
jgi:alpha-tubulin suppressor-like RCC1 family protein